MLSVQGVPLGDAPTKAIRAWLANGSCQEFLNHLSALEAIAIADAGNEMASEDSDQDKATGLANQAKHYRALINLLNEARNPDSKFTRAEIKQQPISQTN